MHDVAGIIWSGVSVHNTSASISSLFTLYFANIIFAASTAKSDAHSLGSATGRLKTPILLVIRFSGLLNSKLFG